MRFARPLSGFYRRSNESIMRGSAERRRRQTVKENLSAYFGSSVIFERVPARPNDPRPVQHGGGVKLDNIQVVDLNRRSVLRVRADCAGRFFVGSTPGRMKRWHDRPRHTLHRSEARSRGSVASTVGRVQRFKGSIAQARLQSCEPSYP